ncbi:MAG TPA: zinc ribbon domain-containing protein [Anaerolineaceae bacterium]|nr:zinc ribbon domain-containing protein [Anaerolineaceae bacterium]
MSLDPLFLKQLTTFAVGFSAAFLAALWLSLIFWTNRDIRQRSRDRVMRFLAVVVVIVFFLPGFLIYLVLRPGRTLEEEYQRSLEEEALLQAIEGAALCPGCERHVQPDWIVCPGCGTVLKKTCSSCGHLIDLPWNICPYCATAVPGMPIETPEIEDTNDPEYSGDITDETDSTIEYDEDEIQPDLDDEIKSQP